MKWNRCKWQRGALPVRFCLIWTIAQFHSTERGTRNAVTLSLMSVERRLFVRGVPGAAMALLACGTGRAETGMGARLSVAYEDVGRQIASNFVGAKRVERIPPDPSIWPVEGAERACHMRPEHLHGGLCHGRAR